MNTKDYYKILGVERNVNLEEIKKMYRNLVMKYHPDRASEDKKKEAEKKFKEISEAYAVLGDSKKRAFYDQYGHAGIDSRFSAEDIFKQTMSGFNSFFKNDFTFTYNTSFYKKPTYKVKETINYTLDITLEEAAFGAKKEIIINGNNIKCEINVNIPIGINNNNIIKTESPNFNLKCKINIIKHPIFERQFNDIICIIFINMIDACLGKEIEIPTLYKKIIMKIPAGTQSESIFRIKNKGIMNPYTHKIGDQLVKIKVTIPINLSSEEKKLLLKFKELRNKGDCNV